MIDIKEVILRSEKDIISSWVDKENIVVSVVCTTFNHEPYIEDAIISFLMQETDFAFEIIIHDDASTDKTVEIVRKYQEEYPNLIKPVFQKENQYSKGGFKPLIYAMGFASGEYLALCEGDDYWLDKYKLKKQAKVLIDEVSINLTVSDAHTLDENGHVGIFNDERFLTSRESRMSVDDVFLKAGQFSPTASMLIRAKAVNDIPKFVFSAPVGDFFLEILSGLKGIIYLSEKMVVYRKNSASSWSLRVLSNLPKAIEKDRLMISSLEKLDELNIVKRELVRYRISMISYNIVIRMIVGGCYFDALKATIVDRERLSLTMKLKIIFKIFTLNIKI